ncbi:MAG: hypothetical protein AAGC79_10545 [Pseudomonadota bacterium]
MLDNQPIIGTGVYQLSEAAQLIQVPSSRLRKWIFGDSSGPAIWNSQLEQIGERREIGFLDLMEARIVESLRKGGVSLQRIKKMRERGVERFGLDRPFSTGQFQTDGKTIFWETRDGDEADPSLEDLQDGQMVFWSLVKQSFKSIEMVDGLAARWRPEIGQGHVLVDPARSFGQPVLDDSFLTTRAIAQAVVAEGSERAVALLYDLPLKSVRHAVKFEAALAA